MDILQSSFQRFASSQQRVRQSWAAVAKTNEILNRSGAALRRSRQTLNRELPIHPGSAEQGRAPKPEQLQQSGVDQVEVVSGSLIESQHLVMDGKHFVDCILRDCVLEYHGHPVVLESTRFERCQFRFGGTAALTMQFAECFGLVHQQTPDFTYGQTPGTPRRVN